MHQSALRRFSGSLKAASQRLRSFAVLGVLSACSNEASEQPGPTPSQSDVAGTSTPPSETASNDVVPPASTDGVACATPPCTPSADSTQTPTAPMPTQSAPTPPSFDSGANGSDAPADPSTSSVDAGLQASAPTPSGSGSGPTPSDASALEDESAELYDAALLPRFDLELAADALAALQAVQSAADPNQDTYVSATFIYDREGKDERVQQVGVRIKGEGSFQSFEQKPALKLKFDAFVDKQRFRGLARLTLNNLFDDASFLAERLAYDVYRAVGVAAPRCNSARVYVNDEFYGVYTNIEAEDKHFLRRWFADASGNLYEKDGFGDLGLESESEFQLETNETENDRSDIAHLLATVDVATDPETFFSELGQVMDLNQFLKLTAVEAAVNQWDMHAFTVYYVHNFRLYHEPSTGLFSWIPWGHDLSMKPFGDDVRRYVPLFELATRGADSNQVTAGVVYQRCLQSAECEAALVAAVEETLRAWDSLDMSGTAARYYEQIRPYVELDPRKRTYVNGALSMDDFDAAYAVLQDTIEDRAATLRAELAARSER